MIPFFNEKVPFFFQLPIALQQSVRQFFESGDGFQIHNS